MDPTIVFGEAGDLRYVLGSPGGPAIILFNLKTIVALIDWGLDPAPASALVNFGSTEDDASDRARRRMGSASPRPRRHGPRGPSRAH